MVVSLSAPAARLQGLGFATAAPGSLRYDDVAWCPGANEPARAALQTMRMPHKMLYILGPAATGARWLAEALATNETFVAPAYSHWCGARVRATLAPLTHCVFYVFIRKSSARPPTSSPLLPVTPSSDA